VTITKDDSVWVDLGGPASRSAKQLARSEGWLRDEFKSNTVLLPNDDEGGREFSDLRNAGGYPADLPMPANASPAFVAGYEARSREHGFSMPVEAVNNMVMVTGAIHDARPYRPLAELGTHPRAEVVRLHDESHRAEPVVAEPSRPGGRGADPTAASTRVAKNTSNPLGIDFLHLPRPVTAPESTARADRVEFVRNERTGLARPLDTRFAQPTTKQLPGNWKTILDADNVADTRTNLRQAIDVYREVPSERTRKVLAYAVTDARWAHARPGVKTTELHEYKDLGSLAAQVLAGHKPTPGKPARSPELIVQPEIAFELRPQSTDGKTLIVLPDTHGRVDLQSKAMDYLERHHNSLFGDRTILVSLGDTIDKGPDSAQNVDALIKRKDHPGIEEVIAHIGNHELWLTEWMGNAGKIGYAHDWIKNRGGKIALESYERFAQQHPDQSRFSLRGLDLSKMPLRETETSRGVKRLAPDDRSGFYAELHRRAVQDFPAAHLEFYRQLQKSTTIGDYFFSHAGVDPKLALDKQGLGALTWIRDPYLNHLEPWRGNENTTVVSGHTILKRPLVQPNKFVLDTGSFMTGDIVAAVLRGSYARFAIFRQGAEPVFTDIRDGFNNGLFAPFFRTEDVIKNPKRK
jgi:serine/threonine protein phosphatase 1